MQEIYQDTEIKKMFFEFISQETFSIPYRTEFRNLTGSLVSSLLLQQILYWANKSNFKPFYKFKAPCNHEKYRKGDSWTEEICISIDEYDAAIKKIGSKITGKTPRSEILSKGGVSSIVLYWTDADHVTWYEVNVPSLVNLLCSEENQELSLKWNYTVALKGNFPFRESEQDESCQVNSHTVLNGKFPDSEKGNSRFVYITETTSETTTENTSSEDTSYPYDVATQHHKDTAYLPVPVAQGNAVSASKAKQASKATTPKKAKAPAAKPKPMPLLASDSDDDAGYDDDVQEETENPTAHQAMFGAVCEAVGWDYRVLDARGSGQVAQTARILRDAGYEAEDVYDFIDNVWIKDWRWVKNNQLPTLTQLRQEIGKVKAMPAAKPDEDEWVTAEVHIQSEWYPNGAIKHERMSRKMATKWGFRIIDPC